MNALAKSLLRLFAMCALSAPAFAVGTGGGSTPTAQCDKGYTYDEQTKTCVKSTTMNDEQLTTQGRALALAGYYTEALDTLSYVVNDSNPIALTYLGYANRKLGHVDTGIAYYHQALAIDPTNLDTREYLGEGYVAAGRTDLAVAELNKLEALCGSACDQYEQLELAIAGTPEPWQ